MSELAGPTVEWSGAADLDAPLIVLLHGWGETEEDMVALVPALPNAFVYASVRAPYATRRHYAWFAHGRSFDDTRHWFERWLDVAAPVGRPVVLVGFSAGAAFAGGVLLLHPDRYVGAAMLCGTLPFDAGVAMLPGRLVGTDVFVAHQNDDSMIPHELLDRAWTYLTHDSGARVHAVRYEGSHGVSRAMLTDLERWLLEVTSRTAQHDA